MTTFKLINLFSRFPPTGSSIERLCDVAASDPTGYAQLDDRGPMVRAARALLGSVTRVLLLADIVVVKQLLLAKDRVSWSTSGRVVMLHQFPLSFQISRTLGRLESVATFTEFVKAFSVFGAEMVELAHNTGTKAFVLILSFNSSPSSLLALISTKRVDATHIDGIPNAHCAVI